jgi:hypothetical protein
VGGRAWTASRREDAVALGPSESRADVAKGWGSGTLAHHRDLECLLADLEDVLAFEHVEHLVLVLVNVERRVDGFVLLEDRERPAGCVGGGFDHDLDLSALQAFAALGCELVRWDVSLGRHGLCSMYWLVAIGSRADHPPRIDLRPGQVSIESDR